jgi:hypothetical protein
MEADDTALFRWFPFKLGGFEVTGGASDTEGFGVENMGEVLERYEDCESLQKIILSQPPLKRGWLHVEMESNFAGKYGRNSDSAEGNFEFDTWKEA